MLIFQSILKRISNQVLLMFYRIIWYFYILPGIRGIYLKILISIYLIYFLIIAFFSTIHFCQEINLPLFFFNHFTAECLFIYSSFDLIYYKIIAPKFSLFEKEVILVFHQDTIPGFLNFFIDKGFIKQLSFDVNDHLKRELAAKAQVSATKFLIHYFLEIIKDPQHPDTLVFFKAFKWYYVESVSKQNNIDINLYYNLTFFSDGDKLTINNFHASCILIKKTAILSKIDDLLHLLLKNNIIKIDISKLSTFDKINIILNHYSSLPQMVKKEIFSLLVINSEENIHEKNIINSNLNSIVNNINNVNESDKTSDTNSLTEAPQVRLSDSDNESDKTSDKESDINNQKNYNTIFYFLGITVFAVSIGLIYVYWAPITNYSSQYIS